MTFFTALLLAFVGVRFTQYAATSLPLSASRSHMEFLLFLLFGVAANAAASWCGVRAVSAVRHRASDVLDPLIIRSRALNAVLFAIGLLPAALGWFLFHAATRDLMAHGLVRTFGDLLVGLALAALPALAAAWCCFGAIHNLLSRPRALLLEKPLLRRTVSALLVIATLCVVAFLVAVPLELFGYAGPVTGVMLIKVATVGLAIVLFFLVFKVASQRASSEANHKDEGAA